MIAPKAPRVQDESWIPATTEEMEKGRKKILEVAAQEPWLYHAPLLDLLADDSTLVALLEYEAMRDGEKIGRRI